MGDAQALARPRSLLRADHEPVLARAPGGPAFGEDVWDLSPAGLPARVTRPEARIDFRSVGDDHWRLLAKEYFWARLNEAVPGSNLLPPQSARAEFSVFSIFANWVLDPAAHPARFDGRLSSLDHAQLDAFVERLRAGRSSGTLAVYLRLVERLHDYSPFLSHDGLAFHPWRNRPSSRVAGFSHARENTTPRIPQEVLGPFLRWALLYVEVASADILAATDELARLRRTQSSLLFSETTTSSAASTCGLRGCAATAGACRPARRSASSRAPSATPTWPPWPPSAACRRAPCTTGPACGPSSARWSPRWAWSRGRPGGARPPTPTLSPG